MAVPWNKELDPTPAVGEEWIYRGHEAATSERVIVRAVEQRPRSRRVDIEFCDGGHKGTRQVVSDARLYDRWSSIDEFERLMAIWLQMRAAELTSTEERAALDVFLLLIPEEVAELEWSPIRYGTTVYDGDALETLTGLKFSVLTGRVAHLTLHESTLLSPEGTLLIAEQVCHTNPNPVLESVAEEERECREKCKKGGTVRNIRSRGTEETSPEWEYQWYLQHYRPLHELLRQWCGHRAITFFERLAAAEAEVNRLDVLVDQLIDKLSEYDIQSARTMFEEQEEERITPEKIRPVVERPLDPSEIPVRYERPRRRWW